MQSQSPRYLLFQIDIKINGWRFAVRVLEPRLTSEWTRNSWWRFDNARYRHSLLLLCFFISFRWGCLSDTGWYPMIWYDDINGYNPTIQRYCACWHFTSSLKCSVCGRLLAIVCPFPFALFHSFHRTCLCVCVCECARVLHKFANDYPSLVLVSIIVENLLLRIARNSRCPFDVIRLFVLFLSHHSVSPEHYTPYRIDTPKL